MGIRAQFEKKRVMSVGSSSRCMRRVSRCNINRNASWRRSRSRRCNTQMGSGSSGSKLKTLQRLIPGGGGLQPDQLLLRTAHYITHLRCQVNLLRALFLLYQTNNNEKDRQLFTAELIGMKNRAKEEASKLAPRRQPTVLEEYSSIPTMKSF